MIDTTVKSAEHIVSFTTAQSMHTSSVFSLNISIPYLNDVSEKMVDNNATEDDNDDNLVENKEIVSMSNVILLYLTKTKLAHFVDNSTEVFNTFPYNDDPAAYDISHTDQSSGDNTSHSTEKSATHSTLHSTGYSLSPTTSRNAEIITMHSILSITDLHTISSTFHNASSSTTSSTNTFHNASSSTTSSISTFHNSSSLTTLSTNTFHNTSSSTNASMTQYAVFGESKLIAVGLQVNGNIANV